MERRKNIFARGADYGALLGIWLAVMALAWIYADMAAPLALLGLFMMVATPVVIFKFQRREFLLAEGKAPFADIWMLGILMIICASLITAVATYVVFKWMRPEFIYTQASLAAQIYESTPELGLTEMATVLRTAIEQGALPSPIQVVMSMFWFTTFTGSVLSAFTAALARMFPINKRNDKTD